MRAVRREAARTAGGSAVRTESQRDARLPAAARPRTRTHGDARM